MCNFTFLDSAYNLYIYSVFVFWEIFQGPSRHLLFGQQKTGLLLQIFMQ